MLGFSVARAQSQDTLHFETTPPGASVEIQVEGDSYKCPATPCNIEIKNKKIHYIFDREGGMEPKSKRLEHPIRAIISKDGASTTVTLTSDRKLWHADPKTGKPPTEIVNCDGCTPGTNRIEKYYYYIDRRTFTGITVPVAVANKPPPPPAVAPPTPPRDYDAEYNAAYQKYQNGDREGTASALAKLYGTPKDGAAHALNDKINGYLNEVVQGQSAFSSSAFDEAMKHYQNAANLVSDSPVLQARTRDLYAAAQQQQQQQVAKNAPPAQPSSPTPATPAAMPAPATNWAAMLNEARAAYNLGRVTEARKSLVGLRSAPGGVASSARDLQRKLDDFERTQQQAEKNEKLKRWADAKASWEKEAGNVADSPVLLAKAKERADFDQKQIEIAGDPKKALLLAMKDYYSSSESRYTNAEAELETYIEKKINPSQGLSFYRTRAEVQLEDNLDKQGEKIGLAYFYLGAAEWAQGVRTGEGPDGPLHQKAKAIWAHAHRLQFTPKPQYNSPLILAAYQQAQRPR